MHKKKKRPAVILIFSYLLMTTGMFMFLLVYSNSYNKLSSEHISPASVTVTGSSINLSVAGIDIESDISAFMPDSRLYYIMYLVSPDKLRWTINIASALIY